MASHRSSFDFFSTICS
uniref:Uncharacterized protein n=1 Tax=Lepeophtheirus salmonis TaxID=72036 RepID=A0A0K2U2R4_LEPSM